MSLSSLIKYNIYTLNSALTSKLIKRTIKTMRYTIKQFKAEYRDGGG
jgi:hypothetical protein